MSGQPGEVLITVNVTAMGKDVEKEKRTTQEQCLRCKVQSVPGKTLSLDHRALSHLMIINPSKDKEMARDHDHAACNVRLLSGSRLLGDILPLSIARADIYCKN